MFEWKEFLNLAEEIFKDAFSDKAKLRTVIGRAYYSVFCIARDKKGLEGFVDGSVHKRVINAYKESAIEGDPKIGNALNALSRKRKDADYEKHAEINPTVANDSIKRAKTILKLWVFFVCSG